MNERVRKLREELISIAPEISIERARLITESYKKTEGEPIYLRRAKALKNILDKMFIYIEEGQLLVGNQAHKPRCAPIFPEYAWDWVLNELEDFEKRTTERFILRKEDKNELKELLQYWQQKTAKDRALVTQPEEVKQATKIGVIEWEGNVTAGEGHITVDFEKALKKGFQGIIKETTDKLDELDLVEPENLRKRFFLEAVLIVLKAGIEFGKRYAALARKLSDNETDERRKKELIKISNICERIPSSSPQSFQEALQMVWFIQLILQIESNGHSISLSLLSERYPKWKIN